MKNGIIAQWIARHIPFSGGGSSDHRIVTAKIQLSLRRNSARAKTKVHYDWSLLKNRSIRDKYTLTLRNKFYALREISETLTPNDEYESFVNAHIVAAAECIPTKQRAKPRFPWEILAVRKKRADVKTASKCNRRNPANVNAQKLKKAQNELTNVYLKEQTEYIQNHIDKITDSVEDRLSRRAWHTINEVSRRKSTVRAKLKATSQQERILLWKEHFKNLFGKPPKVTHDPVTRIISKQLHIKLGQFMQEELDSVQKRFRKRKAEGFNEIPPEVWKTWEFNDILLRHCNAVYNQNTKDWRTKRCIISFPKKDDLGIAKNYRDITLTSKELQCFTMQQYKTQNAKIFRKNQNGIRRDRFTTSQILTIRRILGLQAKNLDATILFVDFSKAFDSIHRGKIEPILLAYSQPKENDAVIMMLYKNTKVKVCSSYGDTDCFDIEATH